ncbi:hypothetical protein LIER_07723 [Lithospermum erythrorhizon]|uniref:SMP domain-containing protein n=1 Tax=Lithospermum erythrorhizon TaxID=34254 RepID=A0AAV3PA66_LITER
MSQEQPRRPKEKQQGGNNKDPIKYGDVFQVSGELKEKPIAPGDAAMMQNVEVRVLGQPQTGGPADAMQLAAARNVSAGLVGQQDVTEIARREGVTVMETDVPGSRIVTEAVGGQVIGQFVQAVPVPKGVEGGDVHQTNITIGEALEAAGKTMGNRPLDQSDAVAIQAAEARATGVNGLTPGGIGAAAQAALAYNYSVPQDEDKVKLGDVLKDATTKLAADKVATREDAEGVMTAEMHYNPQMVMKADGVAASVTAAARINEKGVDMDAST